MAKLVGTKIALTLLVERELQIHSFYSKKELIEFLLNHMDVSEIYEIKDSTIPKILNEKSKRRKQIKS